MKGSREPFHARMVPYYGSTDHHAFVGAPISVPATSLTNWPDEFIHSTGDDLEQIDATQLERNALVVSAVAWYFATVGDEEAPVLAAYVAARGQARLAADAATAVAHLAEAPRGRAAGRLPRRAQPDAPGPRAREGARSARCGGCAARPRGRARRPGHAPARRRPGRATCVPSSGPGRPSPGAACPTSSPRRDEQAMDAIVYVPAADLATWYDAMEKVRPVPGLHRHDAVRGLQLRGRQAHRARGVRGGGGGGPRRRALVLREVAPADVREALERAARAGASPLAEMSLLSQKTYVSTERLAAGRLRDSPLNHPAHVSCSNVARRVYCPAPAIP